MAEQLSDGKGRGLRMRITTKGQYALRLMVDLATNSGQTPVSLKDVAKRQEISDKYLEQIIAI